MPRKSKFLEWIKVVRSKGNEYLYFDTGTKTAAGKPILTRLPERGSVDFGTVYGHLKGARTRRANVARTVTLADAINAYQRGAKFRMLADSSQRTYLVYLNKLADQFGNAPTDEFVQSDVSALLESMKPIAANAMLLVIRNVYKFARKNALATTDPAKDFDYNDTGEHEAWPEALVEAALVCDDPYVRNPVALLYYTGQRLNDGLKMRWSDITDGYMFVRQQKTKKELDIRLHRDLNTILDMIPRGEGVVDIQRTILADEKGKRLVDDSTRIRIQRWATGLGFKIVPHGLRKNAVIALLEAGCSTAEVSSITGQSLAMVERYARSRNNRRLGSAAVLKWEANRK